MPQILAAAAAADDDGDDDDGDDDHDDGLFCMEIFLSHILAFNSYIVVCLPLPVCFLVTYLLKTYLQKMSQIFAQHVFAQNCLSHVYCNLCLRFVLCLCLTDHAAPHLTPSFSCRLIGRIS